MYTGTAGWSIPKEYATSFPSEGSHLQRYSQVFSCAEINSSFYKEHMPKTYLRWAQEVPKDFRFSVKLSQSLIHECKLRPKTDDIIRSLAPILHLGEKLGVILIQLPGSMEFDPKLAERFYRMLRRSYEGPLVIEPRNISWISTLSQELLINYKISKVTADPERCSGSRKNIFSAGGITYYRLHGSPVIYRSSYSAEYLIEISKEMRPKKNVWCIFDNTTFGKATENAFDLKKILIN